MKKFFTIEDNDGNVQGIIDFYKVSFVAKDGEKYIEMDIDSVKHTFNLGDSKRRDKILKDLVVELMKLNKIE